MNRVVHAHIKSIMPDNPDPDEPVVHGGGSRPNIRFQRLCQLAGIRSKANAETGPTEPWILKHLRKTCATSYDEHVPESSIEILGHSVGGITYRHYAHRAPLAFKAIRTLPQPSAFWSLLKGFDGECPCCRRRFADAQEPQSLRPTRATMPTLKIGDSEKTSFDGVPGNRLRLPDSCEE